MRMNLKTLTSAAVIIFAFAGASAHADALDDIKAAKKIRIAIDLGTAPDGMTDSNMQPTGRDVEVGRLLAKDLGVAMEIINTTGPTRIPLLQTNKADLVISTLSITAERAKIIDYSIPYTALQSVVAGLKPLQIKDYPDLVGKAVAVTRGTTQDTDLTRDAKGAQIVRYDDDNTMMTAAATGQSDIVATSVSLINTINTKNPNRQFEPKFVQRNFMTGMGMRKGEPRLVEWVNAWIKTNLKNGNLNAIEKKYHGADLAAEVLKSAE
jgi:polar amino acid transport system substrate-binding protein